MTREFELHLRDPKAMFVNPLTYDPFDENALGEAGLDYLVARMIGFWLHAPDVHVDVYLPPEQLTPDLPGRMTRAMKSYCEDLLVANRRERIEFLVNNTIFLGVAVVVLVASWWAQGALVSHLTPPDSLWRDVLSYGLDILVWVALWTPVSAFLIEWFPLYRRYQAYQALLRMKLTLHPEPSPLTPSMSR